MNTVLAFSSPYVIIVEKDGRCIPWSRFFTFSTLFNLVLTVIWFISGIRDLQGKDPFINLPFNQYNRDPEYRAFWQKKNGVFYMLNSIAFLILAFTPVTSLIYRIIFGIAIVGDLLYLVAYESWNHSAD